MYEQEAQKLQLESPDLKSPTQARLPAQGSRRGSHCETLCGKVELGGQREAQVSEEVKTLLWEVRAVTG